MKEKFLFYDLLTDDEKEDLKIKSYKKGDIVTNFETTDDFYFILEGNVRSFRHLDRFRLAAVSVLSEGYLIGALMLLMEVNSSYEIIVTSDTSKIIKINSNIIKRLKNESIEFNSYLLDIIVNRMKETVEVLTIRNFTGIKGIIAYYLIRDSKDGYMYIKNYDEIIKYLNISHNGFYSAINKLIKDKLIEKSSNSIKILDYKGLKELYIDFIN